MHLLQWLFAASALAVSVAAPAQDWPRKPVRLVVPFPPGGAADLAARILGEGLGRALGQPVVIDNRPGSAGAIGAGEVARAPHDGHTLLFTGDPVVTVQLTQKDLGWNLTRDLIPITQVARQPLAVAVHPSLGVDSLEALLRLARSSPGKYPYAHVGQGTSQHLAAELIKRTAGVDMPDVPYKGGASALQDLVGGQVQVAILGAAPLVAHARSGRIRVLAVTSRERSAQLPDAPTLEEAGFPGFDVSQWFGLFAPAGTHDEIVRRVQAETAKVLANAEVRERLAQSGLTPIGTTPHEFARIIRTDIERWSPLAAALASGTR
jgi:tripartite-type tricarboxylate transporter receptor subunit TctC